MIKDIISKLRVKKKVKDPLLKGFSITKNGTLIKYRGKDLSVIIPSVVKVIGTSVFEGKKHIVSVTIPSGVTRIKAEAFEGCKSLSSIKLPETLEIIDEEAFEDCKSLKTIIIPSSVRYIGKEAFKGFTNNQTIIIMGNEKKTDSFSRSWLSYSRANVIYKEN